MVVPWGMVLPLPGGFYCVPCAGPTQEPDLPPPSPRRTRSVCFSFCSAWVHRTAPSLFPLPSVCKCLAVCLSAPLASTSSLPPHVCWAEAGSRTTLHLLRT